MNASPLSYNDYTRLVNETLLLQLDRPFEEQWRRGQAYFNILQTVRPELAAKVDGTMMDPFYDDSRVPQFCAWVCLHWGGDNE